MSWPSIEKALVKGIRETLDAQCGVKVPPSVESLRKFVRVARGPGSDDRITDSPLMDVECFSNQYETAEELSEQVRQFLHSLQGQRVGGVLIDRVQTSLAPMWVDYRNPNTNRFVASYRLEYRQTERTRSTP